MSYTLLSKRQLLFFYEYRALLFNGENMKQLGEPIKNEKLAETLSEIARNPHSFYNGSLAVQVAEDVRKAKGIMTLDDLKQYKVERKAAIVDDNLGDLTLYATDPPSSGAVVTLIINILKGLLPCGMTYSSGGPSSLCLAC